MFVVMMALLGLAGGCRSSGGEPGLARPAASTTSPSLAATTTVPVTTTAPASSTTTAPHGGGVVLRPDGLGVVDFGDEAGAVLARLTGLLGPPGDDRPLASCPSGAADRLVQFSELGVLLAGPPGSQRLVAWDIGPASGAFPELTTAEGVGVGSTVAELRAAYGDRLEISGDDAFGPSFDVRAAPPGALSGTLTGTAPSDTVASMGGGTATCAA